MKFHNVQNEYKTPFTTMLAEHGGVFENFKDDNMQG